MELDSYKLFENSHVPGIHQAVQLQITVTTFKYQVRTKIIVKGSHLRKQP